MQKYKALVSWKQYAEIEFEAADTDRAYWMAESYWDRDRESIEFSVENRLEDQVTVEVFGPVNDV